MILKVNSIQLTVFFVLAALLCAPCLAASGSARQFLRESEKAADRLTLALTSASGFVLTNDTCFVELNGRDHAALVGDTPFEQPPGSTAQAALAQESESKTPLHRPMLQKASIRNAPDNMVALEMWFSGPQGHMLPQIRQVIPEGAAGDACARWFARHRHLALPLVLVTADQTVINMARCNPHCFQIKMQHPPAAIVARPQPVLKDPDGFEESFTAVEQVLESTPIDNPVPQQLLSGFATAKKEEIIVAAPTLANQPGGAFANVDVGFGAPEETIGFSNDSYVLDNYSDQQLQEDTTTVVLHGNIFGPGKPCEDCFDQPTPSGPVFDSAPIYGIREE